MESGVPRETEGAAGSGDQGEDTAKENCPPELAALQELISVRTWLQAELLQYKTQLLAAKDKSAPSSADPEELQKNLGSLHEELIDVSTDVDLRDLITKRIEYGSTLVANLFPASNEGDSANQSEAQVQQQRAIKDLVMEQTALASDFLKTHEENQNLLKEVNSIKKENIDLKHEVRVLMDSLLQINEARANRHTEGASEETKFAREQLEASKKKVQLICHLFPALILGSGVNWAQDQGLTELLLSMGQPLSSHLN